MIRRHLLLATAAIAVATPLTVFAAWVGAPGNPPNSNTVGPVFLQSGTPAAQTGSMSVSGDATVGDDLVFTASGQAIEVNGSGPRLLNIGNWGVGANGLNVGLYGHMTMFPGNGSTTAPILTMTGQSRLNVYQICLTSDTCVTTWPTGGAGSYVLKAGDTMSGRLTVGSNGTPITGAGIQAFATTYGIEAYGSGIGVYGEDRDTGVNGRLADDIVGVIGNALIPGGYGGVFTGDLMGVQGQDNTSASYGRLGYDLYGVLGSAPAVGGYGGYFAGELMGVRGMDNQTSSDGRLGYDLYGVYGESAAAGGYGGVFNGETIGVQGQDLNSTNYGRLGYDIYGVYGRAPGANGYGGRFYGENRGLHAQDLDTGSNGALGMDIYGGYLSGSMRGGYAQGPEYGFYGYNTSSTNYGILGYNQYGTYSRSNTIGGAGVYGESSQSGFGVYGYAGGATGIGVRGRNGTTDSEAHLADGNFGVWADGTATGYGAYARGGIYGARFENQVSATNQVTLGGPSYGISATGTGLGARFSGTGANAVGVHGISGTGVGAAGVRAISASGNGLYANGGLAGVYGVGTAAGSVGGRFENQVTPANAVTLAGPSFGIRATGTVMAAHFVNSATPANTVRIGGTNYGIQATGTMQGGRFVSTDPGTTGLIASGTANGITASGGKGIVANGLTRGIEASCTSQNCFAGHFNTLNINTDHAVYAVHGSGQSGGSAIYGWSGSTGGRGVEGEGPGTGVYGSATQANGTGVYGYAFPSGGTGVEGFGSTYGSYFQGGVYGVFAYGETAAMTARGSLNGSLAIEAHGSVTIQPRLSNEYAGLSVSNPDNIDASVSLDWIAGWPRIRYGGNGAGASSGFAIQGPGDADKLVISNAGNLTIAGSSATKAAGTTWAVSSDIRLKDVLGSYEHGLDEISKLQPIYYTFKENNGKHIEDTTSVHIGFSAQDVEKVIPEAVSMDKDGYRSLDSDPIMWAMVNSIKELKTENDALKARIDKLEAK